MRYFLLRLCGETPKHVSNPVGSVLGVPHEVSAVLRGKEASEGRELLLVDRVLPKVP